MSASPPLDMAEEMSAAAVKAFEEAEVAEAEQKQAAKAAAQAAEEAEQKAKASSTEATQGNAAIEGLSKKITIGRDVFEWNNPESKTGMKQKDTHDKILKYYGMESLTGEERMKMLRAFYHGTCQTHQTILQSAHCEPVRVILQTLSMKWLSGLVPDETQATLKSMNASFESQLAGLSSGSSDGASAEAATKAAAEAAALEAAKKATATADLLKSLSGSNAALLQGSVAPSAPYYYHTHDGYIFITTNESTRALCADLESMKDLQYMNAPSSPQAASAAVVNTSGDDSDDDPNDQPSSSSSSSSSSSAQPAALHTPSVVLDASSAALHAQIADLTAKLTEVSKNRNTLRAEKNAAASAASQRAAAEAVAAPAVAAVHAHEEGNAARLVANARANAAITSAALLGAQQELAASQKALEDQHAAMDAAAAAAVRANADLQAAHAAALVAVGQEAQNAARQVAAAEAAAATAASDVAALRAAMDAATTHVETLRAEMAAQQAVHDAAATALQNQLRSAVANRNARNATIAAQQQQITDAMDKATGARDAAARLETEMSELQLAQAISRDEAAASQEALRGELERLYAAVAQADRATREILNTQAADAQAALDAATQQAAVQQAAATAAAADLQARLDAATREAADAAAQQATHITALTERLDQNQIDLETANQQAAQAAQLATQREAEVAAAAQREADALARVEALNRLAQEKTAAANAAMDHVAEANARATAAQEEISRQMAAASLLSNARNRTAQDAIASARAELDGARRDMHSAQAEAAKAEDARAAAAAQVKASEDSAAAAQQQVADMEAAAERAREEAAAITAEAERLAAEQAEHIAGLEASLAQKAATLALQEEEAAVASQKATEQATQLAAQRDAASAEAERLDSELNRLRRAKNANNADRIAQLEDQAARIAALQTQLAGQDTAAEQLAAQRLTAANEAAAQLAAQQAALDELNAQLAAQRVEAAAQLEAQLAAQQANAATQLAAQERRAEEAMATAARLEQEKEEARAQTVEVENMLSSFTNNSTRLTGEQAASIAALEAEKADLEARMVELDRARSEAVSAADAASSKLPQLRTMADQLHTLLEAQTAKVKTLEDTLVAQRTNANQRVTDAQAAANGRVAAAEAAAADQRQLATNAAARAAVSEAEITRLQEGLAAIQQAQEASGTQTAAQMAQIAQMEAQLEEQQRMKIDADQKAAAADMRAAAADQKAEEAQARANAAEAAIATARANAEARQERNAESQRGRNANAALALQRARNEMTHLDSVAQAAIAQQAATQKNLNAVAAQRNQLQAALEARIAANAERNALNRQRNEEHAAELAQMEQSVIAAQTSVQDLTRAHAEALQRGQQQYAEKLDRELKDAEAKHAAAMAAHIQSSTEALENAASQADADRRDHDAEVERQRADWAAQMAEIEIQRVALEAERTAAAAAASNAEQEMNRVQAAAAAATAEMKAAFAAAQQASTNTLTASQRNKNDAIVARQEAEARAAAAEKNAIIAKEALSRARAAAVQEQQNAMAAAQLAAKAAAETVAAKAAQEQLQKQQEEIHRANLELQRQIEAAEQARAEATSTIASLERTLANTSSRANVSNAKVSAMEEVRKEAHDKLARNLERINRLKASLEEREREYAANAAEAQRKLDAANAERKGLQANHEAYRASTTQQLETLQADLARTKSALSQLGPQMASLQQQLAEASRSHNGKKTEKLEQQIAELEAKRQRLHEQRDRVRRHLDTIHLNPITSNSILPRNSLSKVESLVQHLINGPFMTWRAFLRHPIALRADDLRSMERPSQNDNSPRARAKNNIYACLERNRFVTMFSPLPDDRLMQNLLGNTVYGQYQSHIVDLENSGLLDHVGAESSSSSASSLSMRIDFLLYYVILALRHPYMKDGSKEFSAIASLQPAIDTFTQKYVAENTTQLDDIRRTCGVDLATEHSEDPPLLTFLYLSSKTPDVPNARFTYTIEPTLQRTMTMTYNSMPEPIYGGSGDKIKKVDEAYKTTYGYGPFTKIYGPMMPNKTPMTSQMISQDPTFVTAVEDRLRNGEAVTVIGYGASGSGKTTTLVYAKHNESPGILAHVANRLIDAKPNVGSGFTSCQVTIYELDADLNARPAGSARSDEKCHTFVSEPRGKSGDKQISRTVLVNNGELPRIAQTHQIHTATCEDAGSFSYGIYQDQEQNKMWGRKKGDASFILMEREIIEYIDTKRNTAPTPNNPNSSRSHVICVLTFSKGAARGQANGASAAAKSDAVFIVCDFAGVENTFMCKDPNVQDKIGEKALVDLMVQGTDESVRRFMQQNAIQITQEDCYLEENVSSYLFDYDPTHPQRDPPENEQYSWTSETIIERFITIERACMDMYTMIWGFYDGSTQKKMTLPRTLQDFKNYKNVTFDTYGQSLLGNKMGDMYRFSDSYLRILNLYRADPDVVIGEIPSRGYALQSIWQILRLIVWYTHSPIRFQTLYQSLMTLQYTNARTIMKASEILSFPKKALCKQRVKEGIFINRSLAQLRSFISTTVRGKNRNPPFMEECEPFQCLPHHLQCFGQGSTNEGGDGGPLMAQIRRHTPNGKTNTFCIFTVVNLSLDANNPPPTPYIDISPLLQIREAFQPLLPRIPLSTQPTMDQITEALRTVGLDMDAMDIKDEEPIAQDFIAYWNRIHNGAHNETDVFPLLEELIQKLIAHNAITTIGTIEFTDSMAKYGATQLTCVIPDSSTVSQRIQGYEQGPAKVKGKRKAKKASSQYAHTILSPTISSALKRVNDGRGVSLPNSSRAVVDEAVAASPLPSAPMVGVRPLSASVASSAAVSARGASASAAAPLARSGVARGTPVSTPRLGPRGSGKVGLFGGRLPTRAHRKANRRTRKKRSA